MKPLFFMPIVRAGVLFIAGLTFLSVSAGFLEQLLPHAPFTPDFLLSRHGHIDFSKRTSDPTPATTGYATIRPRNIKALVQTLREHRIEHQIIDNLGLVRLKETDLATIPLEEQSKLFEQQQTETIYRILRTPNDPYYSSQSYFDSMQAPAAWDITTGSSSITVAVIDTGVMGNHPDLSGKVGSGYDYINSRALTGTENSDDNGHGTILAGIIAASTNNGVGVAGVDWNAHIMPIKAISSNGSGTDTDIAQAIRYGVDHGAKVINMSFGGAFSQTLKDQVDYAWSNGVVLVAASGNNGNESTLYPAGWDNVISVGSVSSTLQRSSFSTYGDYLDIVARGESILSTDNSGTYSTASGTSVAAPFVSGTVALLMSQNSSLDKNDVVSAIETTAQDINSPGKDKYTGYGLLRISGALQAGNLYHYNYISQNAPPQIAPGQAANLVVTLHNSGSATWQKGTVNLATDRSRDRISLLMRESGSSLASGWLSANRITMKETSVVPGSDATYSFWYQAAPNLAPGIYREYFRLVADGITWLPEDPGLYWDVKVLSPLEQYQPQFVSQNAYPSSLNRNQSYQFRLTVKNTGSATWQKGTVNLGTDRERDRIPEFLREGSGGSGWISPNRITMQETSVSPGSNANFIFWLKNNGVSPGTYRQYFRLVADGVGWMEDLGVYWDILVQPEIDTYQLSYLNQDASLVTLPAGVAHQFTVIVRNNGSTTWTNDAVHLGTSHDKDRIPVFTREGTSGAVSGWTSGNRVKMSQTSVAPGETATFQFWLRNDQVRPGTYREYFQLVADGVGWMPDYGIYWDIVVP